MARNFEVLGSTVVDRLSRGEGRGRVASLLLDSCPILFPRARSLSLARSLFLALALALALSLPGQLDGATGKSVSVISRQRRTAQ